MTPLHESALVLRVLVAVGLALFVILPGVNPVRGDDAFAVSLDGIDIPDNAAHYYLDSMTAVGQTREHALHLSVPAGYWAATFGGVELTARATRGVVTLELFQGNTLVASGVAAADDSIVVVRDLPTGHYTIRLTSQAATTEVTGLVQREMRPALPAEELLPDLVVLPIEHVSTVWQTIKAPGMSCRPLEIIQGPATRCLRFDTRIANAGVGPLTLTIPQMSAISGAALGGAHFTQLVQKTDGSLSSAEVGDAVYHLGHNHYHYGDMVVNTLYHYDLATHTRGDVAVRGQKEGICPYDMGLIALGMPGTQTPGVSACQVGLDNITLQLGPNYLDVYPANIDDQQVDITNVPPGIYELVTAINPDGYLRESRTDNNENSVIVQIDASGARAISGGP